jgi:hypothetical protein
VNQSGPDLEKLLKEEHDREQLETIGHQVAAHAQPIVSAGEGPTPQGTQENSSPEPTAPTPGTTIDPNAIAL